jgi:hypothetical protein
VRLAALSALCESGPHAPALECNFLAFLEQLIMTDNDGQQVDLKPFETSSEEGRFPRRPSCISLCCAIGNGPVAPRFLEFSSLYSRA